MCEPGYWWVTTAIEVLVVLMLIGVSLWVIKHLLRIRKNRLGITFQARQKYFKRDEINLLISSHSISALREAYAQFSQLGFMFGRSC